MSSDPDTLDGTVLVGARIFDGTVWHDGQGLMLGSNGRVRGIVPVGDIPAHMPRTVLDGGMLVPGFIDLQANGGGGVLLNEQPSVEGIETICAAHRPFGTTALLPTLITDTTAIGRQALEAGRVASAQRVPGFLGLHMEGPHLALARKGTHAPDLIRPMTDADLQHLAEAAKDMPVLLSTVAPETVTRTQIQQLVQAGVVVSLGHSDAPLATARDAVEAGATLVTHLFNAMSPLGHREPGMVGNALDTPGLHVGLIADGIHVDPVAIAIALRAKRPPGHVFLVTDAMATLGTALDSFTLNGRTIYRRNGRLTLADGTLAGADIDMISSVRFMHDVIGLPLDEALRMASLYPAMAIRKSHELGHLRPGAMADIAYTSEDLKILKVWVNGRLEFEG
jgi:N-acetylglucosamine-6-phosphate deacetylase